MISSKQRAKLKSIISTEQAICNVGKDGLSELCVKSIEQALDARELIKINVLQNCELSSRQVADMLIEKLNCEIVDVLGRKIVVYKFNKEKKTHILG